MQAFIICALSVEKTRTASFRLVMPDMGEPTPGAEQRNYSHFYTFTQHGTPYTALYSGTATQGGEAKRSMKGSKYERE